ncbi:putative transcriptional regulator, ArsR family [Candidatus Fervidibacteria bacterium JGI MDM2 SSWTFF-3-K9]
MLLHCRKVPVLNNYTLHSAPRTQIGLTEKFSLPDPDLSPNDFGAQKIRHQPLVKPSVNLLSQLFTNSRTRVIMLAAQTKGKGRRTLMIGTGRIQNLSPTRLAIIRLLKEWGKGTATQLGKALGISRIAAHQHLDWLKEHGLVQVKVERKGRGRPAEVFSLTDLAQEQFFPRRYDVLAFTALDEVASELGDKFLIRIFRRYREKLTERLGSIKGSLRERVQTLADLFTDEGYLASVEETDDGFVLSFVNCPIAQIARRFQEACISEEEVLTKILGIPVTSECRQVSGSACCRYFIPKQKVKGQGSK